MTHATLDHVLARFDLLIRDRDAKHAAYLESCAKTQGKYRHEDNPLWVERGDRQTALRVVEGRLDEAFVQYGPLLLAEVKRSREGKS